MRILRKRSNTLKAFLTLKTLKNVMTIQDTRYLNFLLVLQYPQCLKTYPPLSSNQSALPVSQS